MVKSNVLKRLLGLVTAVVMAATSSGVGGVVNARASILPSGSGIIQPSAAELDRLNQILESRAQTGLVGFEGDYALPKSGNVSVVVLFEHDPPATQQVAARALGRSLTLEAAVDNVERDHERFKSELGALFASSASPRLARSVPQYAITHEYTEALNGAAITLPADKVKALANFDSVWAVYPDYEVRATSGAYAADAYADALTAYGSKDGNAQSRNHMGADKLHADGITGSGITVCIIDSGIDYNHPAFKNAFLTTAPSGNAKDLLNGKFYGRNLAVSSAAKFPDYPDKGANDPMETTYAGWKQTDYIEINEETKSEFYTSHGTHVSGTVASRDVSGNGISSVGIAPDAKIFVYRVLGPYGSGPIPTS